MSETIKWIVAVLITLVGALFIEGTALVIILFMKHPWTIGVAMLFVVVTYVVKFSIVDRRLS